MRRELKIDGMDCAGCARTVKAALSDVPGVESVDVRLMAESATVDVTDDAPPTSDVLHDAVRRAGFRIRETRDSSPNGSQDDNSSRHQQQTFALLAVVAGLVLAIAGVGHGLGLFEWLEQHVPWPAGLAAVAALGYPVFREVGRAAWNLRVTAHTLMTVGVLGALVIGEWMTALVIVVFMRVGDHVERATTDRARGALRSLVNDAPQTARIERDGETSEIPVEQVHPGDVVVVRPGEKIPVDGVVASGAATVDTSAITGEPMPDDVATGDRVYAATIAQGGALRVETQAVGDDTTFGRVIRMVEEAEAHQGPVQQWADQFSGYYLPIVGSVAAVTYLVSRDPMATVAVLVVACSCAFALATPVAMLASIGTAARRGLLVKGGRYLEALARADVLLLDKTGTLTLGTPTVDAVRPATEQSEGDVLRWAASAEAYAEHALAAAIRDAASERGIDTQTPSDFEAVPGQGVRATVDGRTVVVGNRRMLDAENVPVSSEATPAGSTLVYVAVDGAFVGTLVASDTARAGVADALDAVRRLGVDTVEVLTGDREASAARVAGRLGLDVRAELLPEDKIEVVRRYQADGRTVIMIGDGVNDAPALAQADVGVAMGDVGTDVAVDAAPIVLMRADWALVPALVHTARRTMRVVKGNFLFTGAYNLVALGLAATGWLPPIWAAALHAIPDLGILVNSSRLLQDDASPATSPPPSPPTEGDGAPSAESTKCKIASEA